MIPVYQRIVDPGKGDCMQAAIASLFEVKWEDVPKFIEVPEKGWFKVMYEFIEKQGYRYGGVLYNKRYSTINTPTHECRNEVKWHRPSIITKKCLYKYEGVNGYFYAGVYSPKYFQWDRRTEHAVIIDRDFNIVHDPNEGYKDLLNYPLTSLLGYNGIVDVFIIEKQ